jgi:CBS domain-containing protein
VNLADVMTSQVDACTPKASFNEIAVKMKDLDVGVIPICENEKLLGVVTDRDLVVKGLANNLSGNSSISEVMSIDTIVGTKEMSVEEAADLMSLHQIRRLPVVENDKLIGIVSLGDLAVNNQTDKKTGKVLEKISIPAEPNK